MLSKDKMNKKYFNFKEIPVWKLSHEAVLNIYKITKNFPKDEEYGLKSQIRRSASFIPANIVEGIYRQTQKEHSKFLYNARGSVGETIYHLLYWLGIWVIFLRRSGITLQANMKILQSNLTLDCTVSE